MAVTTLHMASTQLAAPTKIPKDIQVLPSHELTVLCPLPIRRYNPLARPVCLYASAALDPYPRQTRPGSVMGLGWQKASEKGQREDSDDGNAD